MGDMPSPEATRKAVELRGASVRELAEALDELEHRARCDEFARASARAIPMLVELASERREGPVKALARNIVAQAARRAVTLHPTGPAPSFWVIPVQGSGTDD